MRNPLRRFSATIAALFLLAPVHGQGHCDGMDGPVVKAAQQSLQDGDLDRVLIWVHAQDEAEVRRVFEQTRAVRNSGPQARELADRYFFETLVRLHRAGEGASYTGLKPAGRDLGPAIPAADRALETGSVEPLIELLTKQLEQGVRRQFAETYDRKKFRPEDVEAGRAFVQAYVEFMHYVERLHEDASGAAPGHFSEEPTGR